MSKDDIQMLWDDRSDPDILPQIIEISKQWREQFTPEAVVAIEHDYATFPSIILRKNQRVEAFLIVIATHLELELLWAAGRKDSFRKAHYVRCLIEEAEKKYFFGNNDCLLCYAKTAAPDSYIEDNKEFDATKADGIRGLLAKMGYKPEYRLESYWKTGDHCLLTVKRKRN
ncbi:hypothetical protein BVX94_02220 [bacterium B17]|nr:hypothetical protein BVX94_02220 [bacterium B17]